MAGFGVTERVPPTSAPLREVQVTIRASAQHNKFCLQMSAVTSSQQAESPDSWREGEEGRQMPPWMLGKEAKANYPVHHKTW